MDRNQELLKLRPSIMAISTGLLSSAVEEFQHLVLRPILKYQNPALLALFQHHLAKRKISLEDYPEKVRKDRIQKIIQDDTQLKQMIAGMVIGMLTEDELENFFRNERELRKRIFQMVIKRMQDQY